jgi:hypothetical protein
VNAPPEGVDEAVSKAEAIEGAAGKTLSQAPDPVVRFRLLRDVLRLPSGSARLAGRTSYFPLSQNWRRRNARRHDWSTRVLALLAKYHRTE